LPERGAIGFGQRRGPIYEFIGAEHSEAALTWFKELAQEIAA